MCRPTFQTLCGSDSAACQQFLPDNANGQASLGAANTILFRIGSQQSKPLFRCKINILIGGKQGLIAYFVNGTPANGVRRSLQIDFICDPSAGIVCYSTYPLSD